MNSRVTALRSDNPISAATVGGKFSTWFGSESEPLFGTVHVPAGGLARGAVVLCPPLGKEQVDSYRGMTLLAQKLCSQELLVLRFDYLGTGDSHGMQDDPGIVARWQRSIETAVGFARECLQPQQDVLPEVALVGLRTGALLGASVAERCGPLTALTLWDPVVRGRSFLHEQRALYSVSVTRDAEDDPRVSIIGAVLHADVHTDIGALDTTKLAPFDCPVLVATRPERGDAKPVRTVVKNQNAAVHTLSDHELFLEPTDFEVVLPTADIAHLASWTAAQFGDHIARVHVPVRTIASFGDENAVHESLEPLGPEQLFAIRTTSHACIPGGPTVVFYSTANEHHVGPVRSWVEVARALAAQGISVVRFDRRGTGESGAVADGEIAKLYSEEGNQDSLAAVHAAGTSTRNVLVAGLCSGSWYASFAARELGVNSAVLLNTIDWTTRRLEFVKRSSMHQDEDAGMASAALDHLHHAGVKVKNRLQSSMPYPLWFWLGTRGLIQVPEISLRALAAKNVRTTVLLSPKDTEWFVENRGPEGMRRLRKRSRGNTGAGPVVKSFAGGDHSLYGRDLRETVRHELLLAVSEAFDVEISAPAPPVPITWTTL
ncbi:MAG: alpha/beta fold hydrolase [Rhodococcus sp. (in: high G+C Gram-positive bacteria)]